MATRIRTLNFLPEVFRTPTNSEFLSATLDQIVDQPNKVRVQGYIGSRIGYGIDATDKYVPEFDKDRSKYQLEPGVVVKKTNEQSVKDFISYPGIINSLALEGGITDNHNRLFESDIYSWDSFTNLDKLVNYYQYYWLPRGPESVTVSTGYVYTSNDYIVENSDNYYLIYTEGTNQGGLNPELKLLRGGTYTFQVNQTSKFWIQGEPGVDGKSLTQPNLSTRDILGVSNNGIASGIVTFTVPFADDQAEYNLPGDNHVDIISTTTFSNVHGKRLSDLGSLDTITSLENKTILFYATGDDYEIGGITSFFDYTNFDINEVELTPDEYLTITATSTTGVLTCTDTSGLIAGQTITFVSDVIGSITQGLVYTVTNIIDETQFEIELPDGSMSLTDDTGAMIAAINLGLFDQTQFVNVNEWFFRVEYIGNPVDPVIRLWPESMIPAGEKITADSGNTWIGREFFKTAPGSAGPINIIPYLSAQLDTLYYQDASTPNKLGTIKLISEDVTDTINVELDILGKVTYTAPNDVKFTNGLKVKFDGNVVPDIYLSGEYYVEGVGKSIELIPVDSLNVPEQFSNAIYNAWDMDKFDIFNWDIDLNIPTTPDYITIARNSVDRNAWARSNRWFHIDVINATAEYNNNSDLLTTYTKLEYKAKRPIIEFEPNLQLIEDGIIGKHSIDFIDFDTTDALSYVAGTRRHYPDVPAFTEPTATINGIAHYDRTIVGTTAVSNTITCDSTDGFKVFDIVRFATDYGSLKKNTNYYIVEIIDATNFTVSSSRGGDVFALTTSTDVANFKWYLLTRTITNTNGSNNTITCDSTDGFTIGDMIRLPIFPIYGGLELNTNYYIAEIVDEFNFKVSDTRFGPIKSLTTYSANIADINWYPIGTSVTVNTSDIHGTILLEYSIVDIDGVLPFASDVHEIIDNGDGTTTFNITWDLNNFEIIESASDAKLVFTDTEPGNYELVNGSRIVFAADTDINVRNKIFVSQYRTYEDEENPGTYYKELILSEASDSDVYYNDQVVVARGFDNVGITYRFDGEQWVTGQQKITVNQAPLFNVYNSAGVSLSDSNYYIGTSFKGTKLFSYALGSTQDDPILGIPIKYSSLDNIGDISFEVGLNLDTFQYIENLTPITEKVSSGYVYETKSRNEFTRRIGWKKSYAPSTQYQAFEFKYIPGNSTNFICDIELTSDVTDWPSLFVYNNNVLLTANDYTVSIVNGNTVVTLNSAPTEDTIIQIILLSDQVSKVAFYTVPWNLSNNPLNEDIDLLNLGDIRRHYNTIYTNSQKFVGPTFGSNNFRDLGDLSPYGTQIIQNSGSLATVGTFLRNTEHNLFNSILFNSREYIKFKAVLMDTINNTEYVQTFNPSYILDSALAQISESRTQNQSFFWSDMLPSKSPYISNIYTFANDLDTSYFPLSKIYDTTKANYDGVLIYLTRIVDKFKIYKLLTRGVDYIIDQDQPRVKVTLDLINGDKITVNEYNQTYGTYVPNTPTKLGLYPSFIPKVVLDDNYTTPTYFIKGHDGSYTKLYGTYDAEKGVLYDFRDQALFEFELRIYNNLKLSNKLPIDVNEFTPGYFRDTEYSNDEFLRMYQIDFLNWIGENRVDYKTQAYSSSDPFTYNYWESSNNVDSVPVFQGNWRGLYQYFYDTSTPHQTPWEMIGYTDMPTWWENRYGPAPYTIDNLVLWNDLENGIDWNNGDPIVYEYYKRPGLLDGFPVNDSGELLPPLNSLIVYYNTNILNRQWKIGDLGPTELSYRRSSSYPFNLVKLYALAKPAKLFNLGIDIDNFKYNEEFDQYLVNNRKHLKLTDIDVYGTGIPKTSYLNWIVDYEKQIGIDSTSKIVELLDNIDVRLVYRLAGFSDKSLLKFFIEKGSVAATSASLLIPDENFSILLYDNPPFDRILYSGVTIQKTSEGFSIYGNSQNRNYFTTLVPNNEGRYETLTVESLSVRLSTTYTSDIAYVPYSTVYYSTQEVAQFIMNYGKFLENQGMVFDNTENGITLDWKQMAAEFLYWAQTGWEDGSILALNPTADGLKINKDNYIVQPLTLERTNFVLNQNYYPIQVKDLKVVRDGTTFFVAALNQGDGIAYGQFNIFNFEHGIVFDNATLFNDLIYNTKTGLRQNRIIVKGSKTAEWDGTVTTSGFIYNQDNISDWAVNKKYTKGEIVRYKNKYWIANQISQPSEKFVDTEWRLTDYNQIQKGLLPNASSRAYESTLYYNTHIANLEQDADVLAFSLIGYRPRDYMTFADISDVSQVNLYKNIINDKGTLKSAEQVKNISLAHGSINYDINENWAIKTSDYGGTLNDNFIQFKLDQSLLKGNPSIIGLSTGRFINGTHQTVPIYKLVNYGRTIDSINVLPTKDYELSKVYPDAGFVNFNDVKMSSFYYDSMPYAKNISGSIVPITDFYVRDYVWLANHNGTWQVYTPSSLGKVTIAVNNSNGTTTINFENRHNLNQYDLVSIINFDNAVNGYHTVLLAIDEYRVVVNLDLGNISQPIISEGIALRYQSQRVAQPSDIINLPLLESEFVKNTVWVDENNDGSWAVYRKSLNYLHQAEISLENNSNNLGSAVAITEYNDYLIGDSNSGKVYLYYYDTIFKRYNPRQTLTGDISFGSTIRRSTDYYIITEPNSEEPKVYIYYLNRNKNSTNLSELQVIVAPDGITTWGTDVSISNDKKWLYITEPTNSKVYVYRQNHNLVDAVNIEIGKTYTIVEVGDTDYALSGASISIVGLTFKATDVCVGSGKVLEVTYELSTILDGSVFAISDDIFGDSIATDNFGTTVIVSAPKKNYVDIENATVLENWGYAYVYNRLVQNYEVPYTSIIDVYSSNDDITVYQEQSFTLSWTTDSLTFNVISSDANILTCDSVPVELAVNDPILILSETLTGLITNKVYFVSSINGNDITIKDSVYATTDVEISTFIGTYTAYVQKTPYYVSLNGTIIDNTNYIVHDNTFIYLNALNAGDIIEVSSNEFIYVKELTSLSNPMVGVQFGTGLDINKNGNEIVIGSPFDYNNDFNEGAIYRYTNSGLKYGYINGTSECNLTSETTILLNGYSVTLQPGNAESIANNINLAGITNILASANDNKLMIYLRDISLATITAKLRLNVTDINVLDELGLEQYKYTQLIECPHYGQYNQFGYSVKFNEFDSLVVGAPTAPRYVQTMFDFSDNEDYINDTLFDNNATQFVEKFKTAGAVYMYDYLSNNNESLDNLGKFIYAQSLNSQDLDYGKLPHYGKALDFFKNDVIIGSPNFNVGSNQGKVTVYHNEVGQKVWSVYRSSSEIVNINGIKNILMFDSSTNDTLINLDYIDPLQGKILGAARENLDYISNIDPAIYNTGSEIKNSIVWGENNVGKLWFDTSGIRYVNYHQNDIVYNSEYWGTLFPDSDVAIYSWVESTVTPNEYDGEGTVYSIANYVTKYKVDVSGAIIPKYYYWVRNTNVIFYRQDKTLSDSIIENYIRSPKNSGISYFAPIASNVFGIYNVGEFISSTNTILNIGFETGTNHDPNHVEYALIREGLDTDFLPGLPKTVTEEPETLYNKLLDSITGIDETGATVPDPWLPKYVKYGVQSRPRQSMFIDRLTAVHNYLEYANYILAQYPIFELRQASFLSKFGDSAVEGYFTTADYWEYINWWAPGYDDSTKAILQVSTYSDLETLTLPAGSIVSVITNNLGNQEYYILDSTGTWTRIGVTNGTIRFKDILWDYKKYRIGFGEDFYDTLGYDTFPFAETRYIIRAINEQLFVDDLLIHRNNSLILLFELIQSEISNNQYSLSWLNKTSLVDVSHTIRSLDPIPVYQFDNQDFLEGYLDEVKPYHVVIKNFLLKYDGYDIVENDITDFDLPAQYNSTIEKWVTPDLVYADASEFNQFLNTDSIWENNNYSQWYEQKGLSLAGATDYYVANLASYMARNTREFSVDNARSLPTNGVLTIGNEQISYSRVDRELNVVSGIVRGINGTSIDIHLPGAKIIMNLPPVVLLNGGRGYINVLPKVTAYIDTTLYPEPSRPASLRPIMAGDTIVGIEVLDPGAGYMVTPEIRIDSVISERFYSSDVDPDNNVIVLNIDRKLKTGDYVQYTINDESLDPIIGLEVGRWYYVNVLQTSPQTLIGLYHSYVDAVRDHSRINIGLNVEPDVSFYTSATEIYTSYNIINGQPYYTSLIPETDPPTEIYHSFKVGAQAVAITTAMPVREFATKLKFDRTSYNPTAEDWIPGNYYTGYYDRLLILASSSVRLRSTSPDINTVLASRGRGNSLELVNVRNERTISYNSLVRQLEESGIQVIEGEVVYYLKLNPLEDGIGPYASGSTLGFEINMPIKFTGDMESTLIEPEQVYYIHSIINGTEFTISEEIDGPMMTLTNTGELVLFTDTTCVVGKVTDQAIVDIYYPDIREAVSTTGVTNVVTVAIRPYGTGGTTGFYVNMPLFFVGDVFGNVAENYIYYVTTVLDNQRFTMSKTTDPYTINIVETYTSTGLILLDFNKKSKLRYNEMVIINSMTDSDGNDLESFGGIEKNVFYYVVYIDNDNPNYIKLSETVNGDPIIVSDQTGIAKITSQKYTVSLSNSTGSMTLNANMPLSPGHVDNQEIELYKSLDQYVNLPADVDEVITVNISASVETSNILALSPTSTVDNIYVNMPFKLQAALDSLLADTTYYVADVGTTSLEIDKFDQSSNIECKVHTISILAVESNVLITDGSLTSYKVNDPVKFGLDSDNNGIPGITAGTIYYIHEIISSTMFTITETMGDSVLVLADYSVPSAELTYVPPTMYALPTYYLYEGMPITFNGTGIGKLVISQDYYVLNILDEYRFTISLTLGGTKEPLINPNNTEEIAYNPLYVNGNGYIRVSDSVNPLNIINLTTVVSTVGLVQTPGVDATFNITSALNGYLVTISNVSSGFAVNNVVSITGDLIGGETPKHDLTMIIDEIGEYGEILSVIEKGMPNVSKDTYYTKVINDNSLALYTDKQLLIPASGVELTYKGLTTTSITSIDGEIITVSDASEFVVNDSVVFTGYDLDPANLELGKVYAITSINGNDITISSEIGGTNISLITVNNLQTVTSMTTYGDFIALADPFFYDNSIVAYNGNLYLCVISNNDDEFAFGKWELLDQSDNRLNALDRIIGYYKPTSDMPGRDITQLVDGVTYPFNTYMGNRFAPEDQFTLDTILNDQPFYPTDIDMTCVTWDGTKYYTMGVTPKETLLIDSEDNDIWTVGIFANSVINPTDLIYAGGRFIATTTNEATPILRSDNGINWATSGYYTPFSLTAYDELPYDRTSLSVASLSLNAVTYFNNIFIAVGENIVKSYDSYLWSQVYDNTNTTDTLYGVDSGTVNSFTGIIAVGKDTVGSLIVRSTDGTSWTKLSTLIPDIGLRGITHSSTIFVAVGENGSIITSVNGTSWTNLNLTGETLNDVVYGSNTFIAVGNNGRITTSSDGLLWTEQSSGTVNNLTAITYNSHDDTFVVVGENNTIIGSTNDGVTWIDRESFAPNVALYDVNDNEFLEGYGPEEMIPAVVTDQMIMTVTTKPGSTWDPASYSHSGFNVVTIEHTPTYFGDLTFSFDNLVLNPASIAVYKIDGVTNIATSFYEGIDYNINWIDKTISLTHTLVIYPVPERLQINVYEIGNGDQLVQSNSNDMPTLTNDITNWTEIRLSSAYVGSIITGNGVIRPNTDPIEVAVLSTDGETNSIKVLNAKLFKLNSAITFQGQVFGGIEEDTTYYVKTITTINNTITVSTSVSLTTGIAGTTHELTTESGVMFAISQVGTGVPWTDPLAFYNGTKLLLGTIGSITKTNGNTNSITCNTTDSLLVGMPIVFSDRMFGSVISNKKYYVFSILDSNEFTIADSLTATEPVSLVTAYGFAEYITNDYAFDLTEDSVNLAKLVFSGKDDVDNEGMKVPYDTNLDYLVFSAFGETNGEQIGYSIPEVQLFMGDGITTEFNLDNYLGGTNDVNAIVEIDGLRINITEYTIDNELNTIVFDTAPSDDSVIAITTFNDTNNQYLSTQYNIINSNQNAVSKILDIDNELNAPVTILNVTTSSSTTNIITVVANENLTYLKSYPGLTVELKGESPLETYAGLTCGKTYFLDTVYSAEIDGFDGFKLKDEYGNLVTLTDDANTLQAIVGEQGSTRITTTAPHDFEDNDLVRIDSVIGSYELNNNLFYIKVISSTQFDIYNDPYEPYITSTNVGIEVTSYVSDGYVWKDNVFKIYDATVVGTEHSLNNTVIINNTNNEILNITPNTTVYFTEENKQDGQTTVGGLIIGKKYYIHVIIDSFGSTASFTLTEEINGLEMTLTTETVDPGSTVYMTMWKQENVDRVWVTLNGHRIPSSRLRLNSGTNISILAQMETGDNIVITRMIPNATPNETKFIMVVDKNSVPAVYNANANLTTWLVEPITYYSTYIRVDDVTKLIEIHTQDAIAPEMVDNTYTLDLYVDKRIITSVSVFNKTTGLYIDTIYYSVVNKNSAPVIVIQEGGWIDPNDELVLSALLGNMIYVNGEQIRFNSVELGTNTLHNITRGVNTTGEQNEIPELTLVVGLSSYNRMNSFDYDVTWNSHEFDNVSGDPLQNSTTNAANFLNRGNL